MSLLTSIKKGLYSSPQFKSALDRINGVRSAVSLAGLNGSSLSFFVDFVFRSLGSNLVMVVPDADRAQKAWSDLSQISGKDTTFYFPSGMEGAKHFYRSNSDIVGSQLQSLNRLLENNPGIFITTVLGLDQQVPDVQHLKDSRIYLTPGKEVQLEELTRKLVKFGYEQIDLVSSVGEFCVRGGLVDVFPYESEEPIRIEFFGDVIESIRAFSVIDQRSMQQKDRTAILPPTNNGFKTEAQSKTILDYFSENTLILLDEPEQYEAVFLKSEPKNIHGFETEIDYWTEDQRMSRWQTVREKLHQFSRFEHRHLGQLQQVDVHFGMTALEDFRGNIRMLRKKVGQFLNKHGQTQSSNVYILLEEKYEIDRIRDLIDDHKPNEQVRIGQGSLHSGFTYSSLGLMVITEKDLYGRVPRRKNFGKYRGGMPVSKLNALTPGDLMVHIDHGIGRYLGLAKITVAGAEQECLKLQYRDGDLLYVNIDHLNRVGKYNGEEGVVPQLNRLGGKDWDRLKEKTRKAVEKMAKDLLQLYALRKANQGFAFSRDDAWQKELEASFIYDETPDQLRTIDEVKQDMQSETTMDRLVCGDVGFGKTEVALRAAFKAVADSKQVAVLVPTTILAQQHFTTFKERLVDFPIEVELLSRFRSQKQQRDILEKSKNGKVDILIGTHRLLSQDVQFKDMGLLIIDEEHRFGVRQKEKLKTKFQLVDVLSLTATPIPRTLHLSLMGSRDMSTINSAPKERLPVITEVAPFDKELIRQAILDEVHRGGQAFIVHNRVRSIDSMANLIRRLVPEFRVAVAHGQMSSNHLEKVMLDFIQKKYDCLVSTMIIESGLDMPNVNTLIVNRADKLGLAQLYQLKGRIGRSNRQAFAYFLTPSFKFLSPNALKRLQTIEEYLELGAGLQIAMRDMEIRGVGNLLGKQQSGFVNAVGFDMYCKLLDEAVAKIKGEETEKQTETPQIDVQVQAEFDAYLPEDFVPMDYERVNIYQRLAQAQHTDELIDLQEELRDRFGVLPRPARVLIEVTKLRILCKPLGIDKLKIKKGELTAYFSESYYKNKNQELLQKLVKTIRETSPELLRFLQGKRFGFRYHLPQTDESSLRSTQQFLNRLLRSAA